MKFNVFYSTFTNVFYSFFTFLTFLILISTFYVFYIYAAYCTQYDRLFTGIIVKWLCY